MLNISAEAQFAVDAVREAAQLTRLVQQKLVSPAITKADQSPVTVADFSAQAIVAHRLATRFPQAVLVGEEDSCDLRAEETRETLEQIRQFVASREPDATADDIAAWIDHGCGEPGGEFWTLDPVDGTKGFLRGDQYAVALALIRDGRVEIGVLGCPELAEASRPVVGGAGSLLVAERGKGCWTQPLSGHGPWRQLHVSPATDVRQTRIFRSVETAHTNTGQLGTLAKAMGAEGEPIPMDSQAKYAALAGGAGEMLVRLLSANRPDYRECIWDQAAGSIVVEEAGGKVTDLDGRSLDFSHGRRLVANRGVLATNGPLHEAALAALREIGA
jgi:3'(2'), 5'-bisphosphate nucleotidase